MLGPFDRPSFFLVPMSSLANASLSPPKMFKLVVSWRLAWNCGLLKLRTLHVHKTNTANTEIIFDGVMISFCMIAIRHSKATLLLLWWWWWKKVSAVWSCGGDEVVDDDIQKVDFDSFVFDVVWMLAVSPDVDGVMSDGRRMREEVK